MLLLLLLCATSLNILLFGRNVQEDASTDTEMSNEDNQSAREGLSSEKAGAAVSVRIFFTSIFNEANYYLPFVKQYTEAMCLNKGIG